MAFIKKTSIPKGIQRDMNNKAGWKQNTNMKNARWVSKSKDGDLIKFIAPNPNARKKGEVKTYSSTYSVKRKGWVN